MTTIKHPGWPRVLDALDRKGFGQTHIEAATGISQPFLSNLKTGKRTSMRFDMGLKLFALYADKVLGRRLALTPKGGSAR